MANIPTGTTLNGYPITYWNRQTEADGEAMSTDTIMPICSAINYNIKAIETMQAATDVIDVFGSFAEFSANSGTLTAEGYLTDKDIIKVLEDETSGTQQTYYQYSSADNSWSFIGSLDPYYSKSEIDAIISNYISAIGSADMKNITGEISTGINGSAKTAAIKLSGYKTIINTSTYLTGNETDTYTSSFGLTNNAVTYITEGHEASAWINANNKNLVTAINTGTFKNVSGSVTTNTGTNGATATINLSAYKPDATGNLMATTGEDLTVSLNTNDNVVFDNITSTSIDSNSIFVTGISSTNLTSQNISAHSLTGNYTSAIDFSALNGVFSNRYIRINATTGLVSAHFVFGRGATFDAANIGEIYTLYVTETSLNPVIGTSDPYSAYVVSYPIGNDAYSYVGIKCGKGVQLMKIGGNGPGGQSYYTCLNPNLGFKKPAAGLPNTSTEGWDNLLYNEDDGTVYC